MNPWGPMAATIGFNYACHRLGLPTLCSTTRRYLPREVAMTLLAIGVTTLGVHIYRGYVD